jgi:hypothetical protein
MTRRAVSGLIIVLFAMVVGHLAWHIWLGPAVVPTYYLEEESRALAGADPAERQLYLRRELFLTQRPLHAWIEVLGYDHIWLYVNGQLIDDQVHEGCILGIVADLTPRLRPGRNVLAIVAKQTIISQPPIAAVKGAYILADGEHPLGPDDVWRCSPIFERKAYWWFDKEFDDRHWPAARVTNCQLKAQVTSPPRIATTATFGRWITPVDQSQTSAGMRRDFEVPERPRAAWLRVTSACDYRLAVNGILLDQQEVELGNRFPSEPVQRAYDITRVIRAGRNSVSLVVAGNAGPPHLLAELEVEDGSGRLVQVGTDERWRCKVGSPGDWLEPEPETASGWVLCHVESGNLHSEPWVAHREFLELTLPAAVMARRIVLEIALITSIALGTLLICRWAAWLFAMGGEFGRDGFGPGVLSLSLVLPTVALALALLATYDPRVAAQDVYQGRWVLLAVAMVPLQWGLLALMIRRPTGDYRDARTRAGSAFRVGWMGLVLCALVATGFWLRVRNIANDALNPDELTVIRASHGVWERGMASFQIDKYLPTYYICGCELEYFGPAIGSKLFDDDRYALRVPTAFWGTLTIALVFLVGRRLFTPTVGLLAAAIYTFSPLCIQMSNFGRYPSLLQVMTLVLVYFFHRTLAGRGPIDRRALWLTAFAYLGCFLSWEAAALIAPGLILAALVQRRGRLATILGNPSVWAAMAVVLSVVLLQMGHANLLQTQYLMIGTGWGDVRPTPMWRYPYFNVLRYVLLSAWSQDTIFARAGLLVACLLAVRHPFRDNCRFLLLIFLTNCVVMSALMPISAPRYSYHLIPLILLLTCASLVAGLHALVRLARPANGTPVWRSYARTIGAITALTFVVVSNGLTLKLDNMKSFTIQSDEPGLFRYADLEGPVRYLHDHLQEGDVVIAIHPDIVNHIAEVGKQGTFPADWQCDYWLETTLQLPAIMNDQKIRPLHRWIGSVAIMNRDQLDAIFANHRRVWYLSIPRFHDITNATDVSLYMRQHMDVVYEDFATLVLLRDNTHRQAETRLRDEQALSDANATRLRAPFTGWMVH